MLSQGIYLGDNLDLLARLPDEAVTLVYVDPPFNTGSAGGGCRSRPCAIADGDRVGFGRVALPERAAGAAQLRATVRGLLGVPRPRRVEARRVLRRDGTLYFHLDYREAHYAKVMLDEIFGRECFLNEIIWAYDYGARSGGAGRPSTTTILFYVKDPERTTFDAEAVDRDPYMAPGLVGAEKARARQAADRHLVAHDRQPDGQGEDRLPDAEAARYPAADRPGLVAPGRLVLDFFAGSGTLGAAAHESGRRCILCDESPRRSR